MHSTHPHPWPAPVPRLPRHPAWWPLWRRWTAAFTLGELLGFGVPALAGASLYLSGLPEGPLYRLILVLAGAGEGAVLGLATFLALRRSLPRLSAPIWIGGTSLAAALAWRIALIPTTFAAPPELTPGFIILAALLGALFLLSIGGVQWLELRRHVSRAGWWIVVNAIAWPLGVAIPVIALGLLPDGAPAALLALTGLGSGALMGAFVGGLTGLVLVRLLDQDGEPNAR
jgi:hypothetical protein